ncbi:MAG: DNA-processing protein DprA [Alphaproteobacteria bacterium]|nr:DNA-processing protein DprA [Alphaproteobacteria bacterium]
MSTYFDQTKIKWLQLIRTQGIGPIKFWNLLSKYEDIERAIETLKDPYPYAKAEAEFYEHQKRGYSLIAAYEENYPSKLKRLNDFPPLISVAGNINSLNKPVIAIVGARNASLGGRKLSFHFAKGLGEKGWVIVSGLARGIDEAAHKGSLKTQTIAVLAGGVDHIYPPEHESLYKEILNDGAIISEMPLSTSPSASLFPRRNRLIAALSQGIIIVEAAYKSGSLITAEYALDLGIDVFAVPGSPLDPRCQGSNHLLKQGAMLVQSANDVIEVVGIVSEKQSEHVPLEYKPTTVIEPQDIKKRILEDLTTIPIPIETLLDNYNYPPNELMSLLAELELEGLLIRHPGNCVSLAM